MDLFPSIEALARYRRWIARAAVPILVITLVFVFAGVATDYISDPLRPRRLFVWPETTHAHLRDALDGHAPVWTDIRHLAASVLHRSPYGVNWIMGMVPVSAEHFLVVIHDEEAPITLALYPTTAAAAEYWALKKRYRQPEGPAPTPASVVTIDRNLDVGHHAFSFPDAFRASPEILVVFDTTNRAIGPWKSGFGPYCLLIARPALGEVEIVPLDWLNKDPEIGANSDIERLFRDPTTGRLFGDGVHLRPFVLKEDPRELEAWLR